jgi:hypothetical protein
VGKRHIVFEVVIGLALCAAVASAQSASAQPAAEDWQFELVPYLWGSAIEGDVGIGNRTAEVDASFSNILDHLHFAAMGLADARRENLVVVTDVMYSDLRGQRATPGPLFSSVNPEQRMFVLTSEGGYRVLATDGSSIDALGGLRFWHLNSELQFTAGVLPSVNMEASRNWADAIAGLRARKALMRGWWASAYGDIGAGGSDFTYQLVGSAGLDIGIRYALVFGYRYLTVDYDKDNVLLDTAMKGPLFGFVFRL